MQIDVSNVQIFEDGNTYAELSSESEGRSIVVEIIQYAKGGESEIVIDEYDVVYHSVKLENTLKRVPTEEEEYKDFIEWLETLEYEGVDKIIVTQEVYDYFFKETNSVADGYIDNEDGMYKFYEHPCDEGNDFDYDPNHDEPADCYSE